jgi:PAS domain-containing protein
MRAHDEDRAQLLEAWRAAYCPPLWVPLRVPADASQRRTPLGARGGQPALRRGRVRRDGGTATDIHDRKRMEDTLRESEEGFRDLADIAR